MDVTCERCQTEYEFDDALVSERGTTVKCTNCGQQFKVYRPKAVESAPERWVVRQASGRELVFTTLRDLQRAITNRQVAREDMLSRGSGPPRALGAIAELEPFFAAVATAPAPQAIRRERIRTPAGLGTPQPPMHTEPGVAPPGAGAAELSPRTGRTERPPPMAPVAAPPPATTRPIDVAFTNAAEDAHRATHPAPAPLDDAPTLLRPQGPAPLDDAPTIRRAPEPGGASSDDSSRPFAARGPNPGGGAPAASPVGRRAEPAASQVVIREAHRDIELTPSDVRASYGSEPDFLADPRFQGLPSPRSRALRWVVALVVLGMVGVAAGTVGRKYIESAIHPVAPPPASDARVAELLQDGEKALADGDLEAAKEAFDKASVLAERDPKALTDLARLAAVRGDFAWLKLRLLPPDQADVVAAAKREMYDAGQRAKKAVDRAAEVAPDSPVVTRAKIDVLRLLDDRAAARGLVAQVGSIASQPETAYVLAMLDLAEDAPSWPTVIDRLRVAATGEQNLLRARGALVYALARSGDHASAKAELEKIVAAPRPYPLLSELKGFVTRSAGAQPAAIDGGKTDAGVADAAAVDARALAAGGGAAAGEGESPAGAGIPGDYHEILKQASAAKASGQLERAEQLYNAALAQNPGDTEALAGLGDLARARGNAAGARRYYEQVHAHNPDYLPATAALADMRWDSGDHVGATALYRDLLEAAPGGAFAARAKDRLAQAQAAKTAGGDAGAATPAPTASATSAKVEAPAPTTTAPAAPTATGNGKQEQAPEIDTSDLPGFKK